jgi:hypothetical protein
VKETFDFKVIINTDWSRSDRWYDNDALERLTQETVALLKMLLQPTLLSNDFGDDIALAHCLWKSERIDSYTDWGPIAKVHINAQGEPV